MKLMENINNNKWVIGVLLLFLLLAIILSYFISISVFKKNSREDKCFGVECKEGDVCVQGKCVCIPEQNCSEKTGLQTDNCENQYYCGCPSGLVLGTDGTCVVGTSQLPEQFSCNEEVCTFSVPVIVNGNIDASGHSVLATDVLVENF